MRAAVGVCDFRGDYQVLGDFLRPPMTAASIKRYVRDLCEWELVAQDREGRYCVTHSFLEPPEEMKDALVRLQQAWLTQSVHLLSTMPASERHVSSALLTVSESTYKAILERVEKMREELLELVRADQSSERVVQFNIQVFPRGGGKRIRTFPPVLAKGGGSPASANNPASSSVERARGPGKSVASPADCRYSPAVPGSSHDGSGAHPKRRGVRMFLLSERREIRAGFPVFWPVRMGGIAISKIRGASNG